ncbi:hypothetical protein QLX67_08760, partial [Balneolaceae bacterium ANBcel3]|nr:hypothetical protein [Balneolaceae bacterium ANBcel3]
MGKYAIVLVGTLFVFIFTYTMALKNVTIDAETRVSNAYSYNQANNIAQSALMATIRELGTFRHDYELPSEGENIVLTDQNWEGLNGTFDLEVQTIQIVDDYYTLRIISNGIFEGVNYVAEVHGEFFNNPTGPPPPPPWDIGDYAAFGDEEIILGGGGHPDEPWMIGNLGTNDRVTVSAWDAHIRGKVSVGSGHQADPTGGVNQTIDDMPDDHYTNLFEEGLEAHQENVELEMPEFPDYNLPDNYQTITVGDGGVFSGGSPGSFTLNPSGSSNNFHISNLEILSNLNVAVNVPASFTADDDIHIYMDNFKLTEGHLDFNFLGSEDDRPTIHMHVDHFSMGHNGEGGGSNSINHGGDANNLILYDGRSTRLNFDGDKEFNMGLFAKQAEVHMRGDAHVSGSIITGGSHVVVEGHASTGSSGQLIYAPNALVHLKASGSV